MFYSKNLTVRVGEAQTKILSEAEAYFKPGHMNAVIGPSGCGKTTLVKAMIGVLPSTGDVFFYDKKINRSEDLLGRVGFAPQFSIAQPKLTVGESLEFALDLNVEDEALKKSRMASIPKIIGLDEHMHKRVESLSGGQLRRIGLGLELTVDPPFLICDEVTSGLDPRSEDQILELMTGLTKEQDKTLICIIHNLAKLDYFGWITVVYQGVVVFQGSLDGLLEFFEIPDALHLYDVLNEHDVDYWKGRKTSIKAALATEKEESDEGDTDPTVESDAFLLESDARQAISMGEAPEVVESHPPVASQFFTLLRRRFLLFFRDRGYLGLTLAITFGFPFLVVIFALDGLPQMENLPSDMAGISIEGMRERARIQLDQAKTGSLVTSLIMFQIILLTLMGSNNGAREIAAERTLYEKERLSGLKPTAYALSKIAFSTLIGACQGAWMCFFVKIICEFPGSWIMQTAMLSACCVAMSLISLAISAMMTSAEKASLLSIYLVGFQLPLSGVVLALPEFLVWICRPFINAYWGWAGYLTSMIDSNYFDAVITANPENQPPEVIVAVGVLLLHSLFGVIVVFWGCLRKQWN